MFLRNVCNTARRHTTEDDDRHPRCLEDLPPQESAVAVDKGTGKVVQPLW
jgi:hypothetical protein